MTEIVGTLIARAEKARSKRLPALEVSAAEAEAWCKALGLRWPRDPASGPLMVWGVPVEILDCPS